MLFKCRECKVECELWSQQCENCGALNTLLGLDRVGNVTTLKDARIKSESVISLDEVQEKEYPRIATVEGLDIVLGGGLVHASVVLLAGEPGIGKSTLILHMLDSLNRQNVKSLYVTGEERLDQIKLRAKRLGVGMRGILALRESRLEIILEHAYAIKPTVMVIDSVQTMVMESISGVAGSLNQVRNVALELMNYGKDEGCAIILVGHVTKDESVAGPKTLEHLVDATLFFEGEKKNPERKLWPKKNRYGDTTVESHFTMTDKGLVIAYA